MDDEEQYYDDEHDDSQYEDKLIKDLEQFMLFAHQYAYWNVRLAYQGVPRALVPLYIDLKMKEEPAAIEDLRESLYPEDVSEIVLEHVTLKDNNAYINERDMGDLVTHLSTRMDYYAKLKLVDSGVAQMFWDPDRGEPVFSAINSSSSESE